MNKKFSTLFAVALLSSAFSANAAVGGAVTKIDNDYLYQLQVVEQAGTDVSAQDLVLAVDKDGDLSVVSSSAATANAVLGNTLWCASMTQSQDYGQNPIFDFTNKANGFVLDLTVGGYDTWPVVNGFRTNEHVKVGGEVSGWEFSPKVNPLTEECYLASYINGNQAAVLTWVNGDVAVSIVDAATLRNRPETIANLMKFTLVQPVCIDLAQEDFNTVLQTRKDEAEVKLTFDKDYNNTEIVNPFSTNELMAENAGIYNDGVADHQFVYLYKKEADGTKSYLRVDTAYANGYGTKFLKFAFGSKFGVANTNDPADETIIPDQYKFRLNFCPMKDSLSIQVMSALYKQKDNGIPWSDKTEWTDASEYRTTLWTDALDPNHPSGLTLHQTNWVKLQDLELSTESRIITVGEAPINTHISFGFGGCSAVGTGMTSVADGVYYIVDKDGKYLASPIYENGEQAAHFVTVSAEQNPAHMPAYQWVVLTKYTQSKSKPTSPVVITNREFANREETIQLYKNEGAQYMYIKTATSVNAIIPADSVKFVAVPQASVEDPYLGYKKLTKEELTVNKYTFNYWHPYADDKYIAQSANDSTLTVLTGKDAFRIDTVAANSIYPKTVDMAYGYDPEDAKTSDDKERIKGLAQLVRTVYYMTSTKTDNTWRINKEDKFNVGNDKNQQLIEFPVFFKENNQIDGKCYHALVQANPVLITGSINQYEFRIIDRDENLKAGVSDYDAAATLKKQLLNETRTSAFYIDADKTPLYRRFNSALLEGQEGDGVDTLRFVEKYRNEYLMIETNDYFMKKGIDFLGIYSADKANGGLAFIVDTAWVNRGFGNIKPQYLISIDRHDYQGVAGSPCTEDGPHIDESGHITDDASLCVHAHKAVPGFKRGKFLINFHDFANDDVMVNADDYKWAGYDRAGFKEAIIVKDTLYVLRDEFKDLANEDIDLAKLASAEVEALRAWTNAGNAAADFHTYRYELTGDNHKYVTWSMSFVDRTVADNEVEADRAFLFESMGHDADIAPEYAAWLKMQNGCLVLSKYDSQFNEVVTGGDDALIFNVEHVDGDQVAVDNENIAVEGVSVVAGNGQVTIMGAAGKNVTITNILGKVIANQTISSDNATIAVPAGIVAVAVEGEAAVKAIVK